MLKNAIESLKNYGNVSGKECDMASIESVNESQNLSGKNFQ